MPGLENYSEPGDRRPARPAVPRTPFNIEPDLSWTKGKHSMRFGWLGTYIQLNFAYGAYAQAVEQLGADFSDSMSDMVNSTGNVNGAQLVSFQARVDPQGKLPCAVDIYGNEPDPVPSSCLVQPPLQSASYARSYRYKDWATYAQDSYKVTPQLTLDLGVRYEHYGVQHNNQPGSGLELLLRLGSRRRAADRAAAASSPPRTARSARSGNPAGVPSRRASALPMTSSATAATAFAAATASATSATSAT